MNVNEQLKAKIDEIDLDAKLSQLTESAAVFLASAKEHAGSLVHDNRAKVDEIIDKATSAIDEKTEGKYHDKVQKAKASFASGLDKIEETRTESAGAPGFDESEMHVGEEVPHDSQADPTGAGGSTVRPESATPTTDSAAPTDTLGGFSADPDPQAWANETDRTA